MPYKNIVLIGFMGAGKTLVSQKLAQTLGWERVSTDEMIEEREQHTISDIFSDSGEPYFRAIEAEVVRDVVMRRGLVIDCGGGVVLNEDNVATLRRSGTIFYLKASPEVIYERVKDDTNRPILNVANPAAKIAELLAQRHPLYMEADHVIEVDALSAHEIVQKITALLGE